jgi:beta-phosphoglucomutase
MPAESQGLFAGMTLSPHASPAVPQAVIFDCDGVLADTEPLHLDGFNHVLAPLGIAIAPAEYARSYLGLDDRAAFERVLLRHGKPVTTAATDDLVLAKAVVFARRLATELRLYPGVVELVRSLTPLPLAVASGARREEVASILRAGGIADCFSAVVTCEDTTAGKPHPAPFVTALARLNRHHGTHIAAEQCLVIEDSVVGITAAHAAGMRCLAVTTSYDAAALRSADIVVPSLADLTLDELRLRLAAAPQPFISRKR